MRETADIRETLRTPDPRARNTLIARHLRRLEDQPARTRDAVSSLRDLLEHPETTGPITHRRLAARHVAAVTAEDLHVADIGAWYHGALGEPFALLDSQGVPPGGPPGGVHEDSLFTLGHGRATVNVPIAAEPRAAGRVRLTELPRWNWPSSPTTAPRRASTARTAASPRTSPHALAVAGPVHEFYLVCFHDTPDPSRRRTEIGWPVFTTAPA
ncbi:MerR family transcriptional regulator [Streptomyces sp. NRRL F-5630]|uniref:MerR family transcriptional regulator n=1 Tax=Streptomyces sp. NRRL F-5630 TaxID=1463864 RepID=UPI003EB81796